MSDLVAFLLARLEVDERVARAAIAPGPGPRWDARTGRNIGLVSTAESGQRVASVSRASQVTHIARHDPARVLAEVAAKRLQIDMTFRYEATIDGEWGCCHEADSIARGECPATPVDGIRMLRLLALPYAEHPGYRSEWSPDE